MDYKMIKLSEYGSRYKTERIYQILKNSIDFINNKLNLENIFKITNVLDNNNYLIIISISNSVINYAFLETFFERNEFYKTRIAYCKIVISQKDPEYIKTFNTGNEMLEKFKYFYSKYVIDYIPYIVNQYKVCCTDFIESNSNDAEILKNVEINDYETALKYNKLLNNFIDRKNRFYHL